jgi:hypothetical protein
LKPRLKSALKLRRDSGLADTSDAETENRNGPDSECYDIDNVNDKQSHDNDVKANSVLNIVGKKQKYREPTLWKSDDDDEVFKNKEKIKSKPVTCDNIKHNTDLYNPDKLNKGQYLEVAFKNDLIFDLDM